MAKNNQLKIVNVVGARPNFMKMAALIEEMRQEPGIESVLLHTGQHYGTKMSQKFFDELQLPKPDIHLEVGSASHAQQTAQIMQRFEPVLIQEKPQLVMVVGDVNSTIACALVAVKLGIKVAHVEAGLRSFDRRMPEEINRTLTDAISDFLFITEEGAQKNLLREGIAPQNIFFVGNTMIDTLLKHKEKAAKSQILSQLGLVTSNHSTPHPFVLLTLHRPSNVDQREKLLNILAAIQELATRVPVVFPIHPRTQKQIKLFQLDEYLSRGRNNSQIISTPPLGYLDFLCLMSQARLVLTDSGGIQEETTVLGVPCLTLRENTERPITTIQGTNMVVGVNKEKLLTESLKVLAEKGKKGSIPPKWDGKAARRIVRLLTQNFLGQKALS